MRQPRKPRPPRDPAMKERRKMRLYKNGVETRADFRAKSSMIRERRRTVWILDTDIRQGEATLETYKAKLEKYTQLCALEAKASYIRRRAEFEIKAKLQAEYVSKLKEQRERMKNGTLADLKGIFYSGVATTIYLLLFPDENRMGEAKWENFKESHKAAVDWFYSEK